ncbi:hypothetical protein [Paraburkholderia silvatlantica]|uniref:Uncharacterized protein n=1 Tax=Paraburkholderia silvatlantica TaxID=321895 RepID=A0A2U1A7J8_9BURK|nr:hypothetical protein [Paraburkholderia silvatlantica]MBB2931337.1 hypothetical protein [Paraburkholderia silvatlantica]PVY28229.1 hypothetical protein C7411_11737 [Paraburkholderia silvatlantica]PXW34914.1 hypothetical protein C7413_11637 [Paraburkholderia silvatlantica]PYE15221.1 hypothetical protein C7410_13539 [Paraburkholderia silvatlantica]TDQ98821.1 hypothetical protein C7412_10437 [Paraburkholderia silvatlantica]
MVAAMVFAAPVWAWGQGKTAGAHAGQGAAAAQQSHGGQASKARGGHAGAASHTAGRHTHATGSTDASAPRHVAKAGKPSHAKLHAAAQRHTPGETHAAVRRHHPASGAVPAPKTVTQKRPAPKPAAVRPAPRHKLVVDAPPPSIQRAIPVPHALPPILS